MPEEIDPEEEQYYQELAEEAREKLRELAPRGTTLFLRVQKDPKYNSTSFWLADVRFETTQHERINMNDYLRDISGRIETRTVEEKPVNILSWYSGLPDANPNIAEAVTHYLGQTIWDDPGAYSYTVEEQP